MSFVNPAQEPRMRARAERSMINHGPRARGVGSGVRRVCMMYFLALAMTLALAELRARRIFCEILVRVWSRMPKNSQNVLAAPQRQ